MDMVIVWVIRILFIQHIIIISEFFTQFVLYF
jgi:hypothetical protein